MLRLKVILVGFAVLAPTGYAPSARGEQGAPAITGRVSSALKLSIGQGWRSIANQPGGGLEVTADSPGTNSVQIMLTGSGQSAASRIVVPLEMRTNEAYALKLTLISSEGPVPEALASIGSVRPSGTLVSSRASEVSLDVNGMDLRSTLNPIRVLHGTRISAGGNFTTPGNALLADLNLAVSQSVETGNWRVSIRLSLDRSTL
jgi:hypothetical protein